MDTTEQLGGTYFYGGLTNLSAGELFFWIMIDVTVEHFTGAKDVIGAAAVYVGQNNVPVRGKFRGATPDTSHASKLALKMLKQTQLPFRIPTLVGGPMKVKVRMTNKLAAIAGRAVPVLGWVILASDIALIGWEATNRYNRIVSPEDKIW